MDKIYVKNLSVIYRYDTNLICFFVSKVKFRVCRVGECIKRFFFVEFSGPDSIDKAIQAGFDLDGSPIPLEMLSLYREVMDKENSRKRSGVKKSMRNRIVKTGSKHFDQETLNARLIKAGWDGLRTKEIKFFYD